MIVKYEKQVFIFLHHLYFRPFSHQTVADSKEFHSNTSYQDPQQNEVYDLKFWSHTQVW